MDIADIVNEVNNRASGVDYKTLMKVVEAFADLVFEDGKVVDVLLSDAEKRRKRAKYVRDEEDTSCDGEVPEGKGYRHWMR